MGQKARVPFTPRLLKKCRRCPSWTEPDFKVYKKQNQNQNQNSSSRAHLVLISLIWGLLSWNVQATTVLVQSLFASSNPGLPMKRMTFEPTLRMVTFFSLCSTELESELPAAPIVCVWSSEHLPRRRQGESEELDSKNHWRKIVKHHNGVGC